MHLLTQNTGQEVCELKQNKEIDCFIKLENFIESTNNK